MFTVVVKFIDMHRAEPVKDQGLWLKSQCHPWFVLSNAMRMLRQVEVLPSFGSESAQVPRAPMPSDHPIVITRTHKIICPCLPVERTEFDQGPGRIQTRIRTQCEITHTVQLGIGAVDSDTTCAGRIPN